MYPDLKAALGGDARRATQHFFVHGIGEGRYSVDRRVFAWQWYLDHHPDLRAAGITDEAAARQHWLRHGIREGRQAHPVFHTVKYLRSLGLDPGSYAAQGQAIASYLRQAPP